MTESIRLTTITLFLMFISPVLVIPHKMQEGSSLPLFFFVVYFFVCLLFMGMEIFEYVQWSYNLPRRASPKGLFFLRLALILLPTLVVALRESVVTKDWMEHFSRVFMLIGILPFYAYFAFPRRVSLSILISLLSFSLFFDFVLLGRGFTSVFEITFPIYRTLTYLFLYALAWLLERQQQSSRENKKLLSELRASENQLREYAGRIAQTVALEERTRLAQDIHDSLGHSLTVVKIQQSKALAYLKVDLDESERALLAAKVSAEDAMSDIRASLKRLNGGEAVLSLKESLPDFVKMLKENELTVVYDYSGDEKGYNYSVLMGLYRLIQEGITNVLKHADAGAVRIKADFGSDEATLELADDGKGFVLGEDYLADKESEQYGLKGLVRRMELVNGHLEISSEPGEGTTLKARVPRNPLAVNEENHG